MATTRGSTRNMLEITKMWIERSSASPLEIRLHEEGMALGRKGGLALHGIKEVVDLIFSQAHWWRDMLITSAYFPEDTCTQDHPFVIASPHLTDLMLFGIEESPTLFLDLAQSSQLYEVYARNGLTLLLAPPSNLPTVSRLNHLYVAMAKSQSIPDFIAFWKCLPISPTSKSLSHKLPRIFPPSPGAAPLAMQNLKRLTVNLFEQCEAPLTRFLSKLSLSDIVFSGGQITLETGLSTSSDGNWRGSTNSSTSRSHAHAMLLELFIEYKGAPTRQMTLAYARTSNPCLFKCCARSNGCPFSHLSISPSSTAFCRT